MSVYLNLPIPPSVNAAFRNVPGKGRALTREAKAWKDAAAWEIASQHPESISGPVILVMGFERTRGLASGDADNRVKLVQDSIVSAGVIDDDRHVVGAAFSWLPAATGRCHILVVPAGEAPALAFEPSENGVSGAWTVREVAA